MIDDRFSIDDTYLSELIRDLETYRLVSKVGYNCEIFKSCPNYNPLKCNLFGFRDKCSYLDKYYLGEGK